MISFILKKIRFRQLQKDNKREAAAGGDEARAKFLPELDENLKLLSGILGDSTDIVVRRFMIRAKQPTEAAVLYLDGMVDRAMVNNSILKPLMNEADFDNAGEAPAGTSAAYIKSTLISVGDIQATAFPDESADSFLSGDTILLIDGEREALIVNLRGWDKRPVEEPKTETVVRGPREGFIEDLRTNSAMLRRKLKTPDFTLETMKIGARTKTNVAIVSIRGLVDPKLIEEIRRRLRNIRIDAVLDSGYVEQLIEDAPYSIFATVANSEKPDKVAAKLLEGRAAILVDGSPFVLTVPTLFVESFQSAEDYYSRYYFASVERVIRFIAFGLSVLLPALYVALTTFHQELIPTPLLLTMAAAREGGALPGGDRGGYYGAGVWNPA